MIPMIVLSGADVYSPFVGEAEQTVRETFQLAREAAPCVLFVDEIDAMVSNRGEDGGSGGAATSAENRVLSSFLNEMDGITGGAHGVVVVAATNRPWAVDAALLRKGRFDFHVLVDLPAAGDRRLLFERTLARSCAGDASAMDALMCPAVLDDLARRTEGWSGADIVGACREAVLAACRANPRTEPRWSDAAAYFQQVCRPREPARVL